MVEINFEIKNLIQGNALALSTVDEKGSPHCIAVGFVKVISKNEILVTDNYMGETVKNLQNKPSVALVVWSKDWKENCVGYEMRGDAKYFTEGKYYEMVKQITENKGEPCKGAILIKIDKIKKLA